MNLVFVTLFLTAFVAVRAANYCASSLCGGLKHIACGHSGKFAGTCPADAKLVTINAALKTKIVNFHNAKRNIIAGGGHANHTAACRMATMQWDNELAKLAALNVRQCKMSHDQCRNTATFKYSGQNLAQMGFFDAPNHAVLMKQAVQMCDIGHFTVMVADRNTRVGCAAAFYSEAGVSYKWYLVACNYATTNVIEKRIYASCQKAGVNCKKGKNPSYPKLCAKAEVYAVNQF